MLNALHSRLFKVSAAMIVTEIHLDLSSPTMKHLSSTLTTSVEKLYIASPSHHNSLLPIAAAKG